MLELTQNLESSTALIISIAISMVLAIILVIMSLRIVWRVEKQLDIFFKLLTLGFVVIFIEEFLKILISSKILNGGIWFEFLQIVPLLLFIFALSRMNNLITKLDKEK